MAACIGKVDVERHPADCTTRSRRHCAASHESQRKLSKKALQLAEADSAVVQALSAVVSEEPAA